MNTLSAEATRAAHLMSYAMDRARKLGERIESQTILCLAIIAAEPDINLSRLGERLNLTHSAVSRNVTRLAEGKLNIPGLYLVVRYEDPMDRRVKRAKLTKKGQEFWMALGEDFEKVLRWRGEA